MWFSIVSSFRPCTDYSIFLTYYVLHTLSSVHICAVLESKFFQILFKYILSSEILSQTATSACRYSSASENFIRFSEFNSRRICIFLQNVCFSFRYWKCSFDEKEMFCFGSLGVSSLLLLLPDAFHPPQIHSSSHRRKWRLDGSDEVSFATRQQQRAIIPLRSSVFMWLTWLYFNVDAHYTVLNDDSSPIQL